MLVVDWAQGMLAAFDITVTSPLTPAAKASMRVGAEATGEKKKHTANNPKCAELHKKKQKNKNGYQGRRNKRGVNESCSVFRCVVCLYYL